MRELSTTDTHRMTTVFSCEKKKKNVRKKIKKKENMHSRSKGLDLKFPEKASEQFMRK